MSTTVTYKGSTLATVNNNTKTLKTAGKYMEGDVVLTDVSGGTGAISVVDTTDSHGGTIREITALDISDTTAVASDVAQGKYFYTFAGVKTAGTATGGGGSGGNVWQDENGYVHLDDEGTAAITVEPLSVTQNGTYTAPTGKAYSPVTVNVSGGSSSSVEKKQINFIDYDGTILYSYTSAEWANVTSLPANPSHTGLTAQGWNWTKNQIDTQLTAVPGGDVCVGQMYVTASGDTEIDIEFIDSARLSPILSISVNGTITVDWGDNTASDTVTGTSLTTRQSPTHTYTSIGKYTIKIHVVSGSFAFRCTSSYLLLRKNTTSTENRIYANCIKAIRLGTGITSIGDNSFYYCTSLSSVSIPSTVTSVGSSAFYYCYALSSITIPNNVTSINSSSFRSCVALSSVAIPSSVTSINSNSFYGCYALSGVAIPSSVTSIGSNAFYMCTLSSILIPNNVTSIEASAFYGCYALSSVTIPSSVTSIGDNAFNSCYGMKEYHIKPTTIPTAGTTIFNSIASDCIIYVPSSKLTDYQGASNWSTYSSYMQGE